MSIRDKFRRAAARKSVSSDATTQTESTVDSSTSGAELSKSSSRPTKSWGWSGKATKKKESKPQPLHPSERPFTETNLRHQELLSHFTMTFGRRRSSAARTSFSGVSPGTSRQCSVDATNGAGPAAHHRGWGPSMLDPGVSPVAEEDRRLQ